MGKEVVKLSLLTDDMILYVENTKEYTHTPKNLLKLMKNPAKLQKQNHTQNTLYFYTLAISEK